MWMGVCLSECVSGGRGHGVVQVRGHFLLLSVSLTQ